MTSVFTITHSGQLFGDLFFIHPIPCTAVKIVAGGQIIRATAAATADSGTFFVAFVTPEPSEVSYNPFFGLVNDLSKRPVRVQKISSSCAGGWISENGQDLSDDTKLFVKGVRDFTSFCDDPSDYGKIESLGKCILDNMYRTFDFTTCSEWNQTVRDITARLDRRPFASLLDDPALIKSFCWCLWHYASPLLWLLD